MYHLVASQQLGIKGASVQALLPVVFRVFLPCLFARTVRGSPFLAPCVKSRQVLCGVASENLKPSLKLLFHPKVVFDQGCDALSISGCGPRARIGSPSGVHSETGEPCPPHIAELCGYSWIP